MQVPANIKPEWNPRLNQELIENEIMGSKLKFQLMQVATTSEVEKYSKYMKNVERAATVLLRLTKRVEENATENVERKAVNHKKLTRQITVAEHVQDSLDRKHEEISEIILNYFGTKGLDKFNGFLKEKLRLSLLEWEFKNDIKTIDICLNVPCDL